MEKFKKILKKAIIYLVIAIAVYIGGYIHGSKSKQGKEAELTRQLRSELIASTTANGYLQSANIRLTSINTELRAEIGESRRVLDSIGLAVEDLKRGIEETGDIITKCLDFVRQLREIYSEDSEE